MYVVGLEVFRCNKRRVKQKTLLPNTEKNTVPDKKKNTHTQIVSLMEEACSEDVNK